MPPIIWVAIAVAIVILGIGGATALPQMPETVIRPVAENGLALFGPALMGFAAALGLVSAAYLYFKFARRGG